LIQEYFLLNINIAIFHIDVINYELHSLIETIFTFHLDFL